MTMWEALKARWLPDDPDGPPERFESYYAIKYEVARQLHQAGRLDSIVEIGVRAGYSAFALLSANPEARYYGIDWDQAGWGGVRGYLDRARKTLAGFPNVTLARANSQELEELPETYDLAHVDGDHSWDGAFHDLELCARHSFAVLVDDYDLALSVRGATDHFLVRHAHSHTFRYQGDGMLRGQMLILRRES